MAASRVVEWIEGGELPIDDYQLAGIDRFHPRGDEVLSSLAALTAENQAYLCHWQPQIAAKAIAIQRRLDMARQTFATPTAHQAYDEWLAGQIRIAYAREFQNGGIAATPETVRRWLRLAQHVHASRIEPLTLRLTRANRGAAEPATKAQPPAATPAVVTALVPTPIEPTPDVQVAAVAKHPKASPVTRTMAEAPDDFGLLWIIGSAIVTSVICLTLLLVLFGERIGARGRSPGTVAQTPAAENPMPPPAQHAPESPTKNEPTYTNPTDESPTDDATESAPAPQPADSAAESPPLTPAPPAPAPQLTTPSSPTTSTPAPTAPNPMPLPSPAGGRPTLAFGRSVHTLAWNASGKQIAIGGDAGEIAIWLVGQNSASRLAEAFAGCTALAFSPNSRLLAAATTDGSVFVWNAATWKSEKTIRHSDLVDVRSLAWLESKGDPQIAVGDAAGIVRLFSPSQGNLLTVLDQAAKCGPSQALIVPGRSRPLVVSAHLDGTVVLWNVDGNRSILRCLAPHGGAILEALAEPSAAASKGAEVTLCDHAVCFGISTSRDEKLLAVAARDLELWELDAPRFLVRKRLLPGNDAAAYRLAALSSKADLLAAADSAGTVTIIDVSTWTVLFQEKQPAAVLAIAWHPTESKLAIGRDDGNVVVIPVTSEMLAHRADPDFDPSRLLATAQSLVADENWYDCSRLVSVVSAFRVPHSERLNLDRLRLAARNGMQAMVSTVKPGNVAIEDLDESTHNLQLAIDIDSTGPLGKQARDLMRQLPSRTPAALAKAEKAASTAGAGGIKKKGRQP
jgi:WD40 repeat protein